MSEAMAPTAPVPLPDPDSEEFWAGCKRGELRMQRCTGCSRMRYYPRPMCPHCQSMQSDWVTVSGRGTIYSFVVCHPPVLPAFAEKTPYAVLVVELEEDSNLRMVGGLLDHPVDEIEIGLPVEVAFEPLTDEITLPQWRVAKPS